MPKQKSVIGSPSNSLQSNGGNLYGLCKDLDKFTRYFIVKAVQVIVQSRLGGGHKMKTDCRPSGNDWFNINISDIVEISDKTKAVLNTEGISVKLNWRVCCEISLKTNDGSKVVLEHWIISNKSYLNSNQKLSNSGQASPKSYMTTRCSNTHLTSSNNSNGASPLSTINTSTSRARTNLFGSSSRNRLNSIGDGSSDGNLVPNKLLMGVTNENVDMKPSTSCFTLSSAQTANNNCHSDSNNSITSSPSTYSLNTTNANNSTQNHQLPASNNSPLTSQQKTQTSNGSTTTNKTSANSSIYTIYNRMSLLLKTLLTTTHVVPAYRLASRTSQTDTCVICYRVYNVPRPSSSFRSSIEDINSTNSESPNKRSLTSTASLGSLDIREFVGPDELEHFCPILKLGSVKTDVSEIDISVCYRTDIRGSNFLSKSHKSKDVYNRILDEDCLTAAKQLLAGNECSNEKRYNQERHFKNGSQNSLNNGRSFSNNQRTLDFLDQPLKPAFAYVSNNGLDRNNDSPAPSERTNAPSNGSELSNGCDLIESAFDGLLKNKYSPNDDDLIDIASNALNKSPISNGNQSTLRNGAVNANRSNTSANAQSEPIQVPGSRRRNQADHHSSLTPGSTPKSLTDSYVFVDLNPPFASDEQNDINSFFHGPSPSFSNGSSNLKDIEELTSQLATFEANASQIDDFVDNMCASEDDEEERDENGNRDQEFHLCPNMGHV